MLMDRNTSEMQIRAALNKSYMKTCNFGLLLNIINLMTAFYTIITTPADIEIGDGSVNRTGFDDTINLNPGFYRDAKYVIS